TAVVLHSVDALHGDLGIVSDGDIILALSYSGESEEMVNLMPALKRFSVKIICLTGIRNPVARETLTVQEALLVMSGAKAGSVSVVNARGKLVGVFTDGDLRRRLSSDANVLRRPLAEVMTRKPICIRADALGAEALK